MKGNIHKIRELFGQTKTIFNYDFSFKNRQVKFII